MSDSPGTASKTVANATLEDLITPKLEPGTACLIVIRGRSVGQMLELQKLPAVIGRSPEVDLTIDDIAVSRRHAQVDKGPDGFQIVDLGSTNGLFVNGARVERHVLHDGDRVQVGTTTILKFCIQDEVEASFQKKLYDSATRDSLTGLYNRRYFFDTLDVDFNYAQRNGTMLSLLLLDLDHFKRINDSLGHAAGDRVLEETAGLIQRSLRVEDVAARHGGEEFAVLLRYTDGPRAYVIAERIRQSIEEHRFGHEGRVVSATVSIGLVTLENKSHRTWRELVAAADTLLYKAKQEGRNRTVTADIEAGGRLTQKTLNLKAGALESPSGGAPKPPEAGEPRPSTRKRGPRKGSRRG